MSCVPSLACDMGRKNICGRIAARNAAATTDDDPYVAVDPELTPQPLVAAADGATVDPADAPVVPTDAAAAVRAAAWAAAATTHCQPPLERLPSAQRRRSTLKRSSCDARTTTRRGNARSVPAALAHVSRDDMSHIPCCRSYQGVAQYDVTHLIMFVTRQFVAHTRLSHTPVCRTYQPVARTESKRLSVKGGGAKGGGNEEKRLHLGVWLV